MSVREYSMDVVLNQVAMIPQPSGYGLSIEPIFVIVNVRDVIDPSISDRFFLQVIVDSQGKIYTLSGVYSMSDILADGTIDLGIIYVIGPLERTQDTFTASIRYITE